jgi:adenylate cyclase class 2
MQIEIEAKVKVDSLDAVAVRLGSLGAKLLDRLVQRDCYFNDSDGRLASSDKGLRIRRQSSAGVDKVILTYKGKRGKSQYKSRAEYEVQVDDYDNMVSVLDGLGYKVALSFVKRRQIWLLNGCEVCLDELPMLGSFVEVEGSGETLITETLKMLELSQLEHIRCGYARLMKKRLKQNGLDSRYICFEGDEK